MNYIVFDLEFNMFFKFKEGDSANKELKSEIIQIGAVKLNDRLETVSTFNMMIKPEVYRRINPYVKKKTNITSVKIAQGTPFREGIEHFRSWAAEDWVLCSWGQDDILGLRENCRYFGINSLTFDQFIDVQRIYMRQRNLTNQPSLENSVEELEIQALTPFHDALSDAVYTAEIFGKIYDFSDGTIVNWGKTQEEDEQEIAALKQVIAETVLRCPDCDQIIPKKKEIKKGKKYFAFGDCPKCKHPVRIASKIVRKNGEYKIESKNVVYQPQE